MKRFVPVLILICMVLNAFSQHDFLFERKSLDDIRKYEKSIESECLGFEKRQVAEGYFPTAEADHDYYPLCYSRTNDDFYPRLKVIYYYDENDSTLLSTVYDWNIMRYVDNLKTDGDKFDREKKRKKPYLKKYKRIKKQLISMYGEPDSSEENKSREGYFYRLRWQN